LSEKLEGVGNTRKKCIIMLCSAFQTLQMVRVLGYAGLGVQSLKIA